jgi:hypothetical protein
MIFRFLVVALFLATAPGGASAAQGCVGGPKSQWRSPNEAKQAAAALNFTRIVKVILEDGCYEVVTVNADGKIVGVQFDPVTLALHKVEDPQ